MITPASGPLTVRFLNRFSVQRLDYQGGSDHEARDCAPVSTISVVTQHLPEGNVAAVWCRVSYPTIRAYRTGDRHPSPETVARFAGALRRHAGRLVKLADRLDREAKRGGR